MRFFFGQSIPLLFVAGFFLVSDAAGNWNKDRTWTDGRAEVAVYDSERVVYGKARAFREQLITVTEDMRIDTSVKADRPKETKTIPVFKMNIVQTFDTENYPYNYLTSLFVSKNDPTQLLKITVGSQEWCGNTFKIFLRKPDATTANLKSFSYFDGEADEVFEMEWTPTSLFRDQLPLSLRSLPFKTGYEEEIRLWDALTSNRGKEPRSEKAKVVVEAEEVVNCHAGSLPSWKVVVQSSAGTDTYWFEKKSPHILTRMETADGSKRRLYARSRWSYWDRRIPPPNVLK